VIHLHQFAAGSIVLLAAAAFVFVGMNFMLSIPIVFLIGELLGPRQ
jgi:hypothetical protein